jgi:hypothetical protein
MLRDDVLRPLDGSSAAHAWTSSTARRCYEIVPLAEGTC